MPGLSWNEIHQRAVLFARDWSSAAREQADKQTFWNEFFLVFGIPRRTVASFEEPVRRLAWNLRLHRPALEGQAPGRTQDRRRKPRSSELKHSNTFRTCRLLAAGTRYRVTSFSPTSGDLRYTTWNRRSNSNFRCSAPGATCGLNFH